MSINNTEISYIERLEGFTDENDDIISLKSFLQFFHHHNSTRNYEALSQELRGTLDRQSVLAEDGDLRAPEKWEAFLKRKVLNRIETAYKILSNPEQRREYLSEIRLKCFASQVMSFEQLIENYSGRVMPFFLFEVYKKRNGIFQDAATHRMFSINFTDLMIEEKKESQATKSYNCSSIEHVVPAFKNDEFYLTINDANDVQTFHYRVKYPKQRDLLMKLLSYSQQFAKRRTIVDGERMKNPNVSDFQPSKKSLNESMIKTDLPSNLQPKALRPILSDRIAPPKLLFKCPVFKKSGGLLSSEKKLYLFVGITTIIVTSDPEGKNVQHTFPIDPEYIIITKNVETCYFTITNQGVKTMFRTNTDTEIEDLLKGEHEHESIIYSLPYNSKDTNVAKILKLRLKDINKRVRRAKELLLDLRIKRNELRVLLNREDRRRKDIYPISRCSSISRTSVSYDKFMRRGQNESYLDDLNESFISVTTSVTKSPIHKDRYTSSNDNSVDGKNWRENRFVLAKKSLKNQRITRKNLDEPASAPHSILIRDNKELADTQHEDFFKETYVHPIPITEPASIENSPGARGYAWSFSEKRQNNELKKMDTATFAKNNNMTQSPRQNTISLFKSSSQDEQHGEDDSIPFYSEINSFGPNIQDQLRKMEYEQSSRIG